MRFPLIAGFAALVATAAPVQDPDKHFTAHVRPVLMQNCSGCHNPASAKNRIDFLKAETAAGMNANRGMWRNVATQLRNRTMPPAASKLTEEDRFRISAWIDERLKQTACDSGDFAGPAVVRRLNRREYRNAIRDLLGVDFAVSENFPADGSGGEGFDTNAETLFLPPVLLERYLEAAGRILDRVIVSPVMNRSFPAAQMEPAVPSPDGRRNVAAGEEISVTMPVFADGEYFLKVWLNRPRVKPYDVLIKVDGKEAGTLEYAVDPDGGPTARVQLVPLSRGAHTISLRPGKEPVPLLYLAVEQKTTEPSAEKKFLHYRLFGTEPGETPSDPRRAAEHLLRRFASKAFRRPATTDEVNRLLTLYDRATGRGEPFEEGVRLAMRGVLVSPNFLFRAETAPAADGVQPVGGYDLASRLSFFLWSTIPDDELLRLAGSGQLNKPEVLRAQVDRMLADPRSRAFANSFIGQWLGSSEVGGRVAPTVSEVLHFYTPEVAADLREEPVLLFHHLISGNGSLLDLIDGNYTFLTERLVKFYQAEDQLRDVQGNHFRKVQWPDRRRGGVLGMGSVLAITSHFKQTSPVLRGAWVLETLLGTRVPPPPPDVPPLETAANNEKGLSMRQKLMRHRADPSCSACHNVMDPIGFAMENFDWLGRWREKEANGVELDVAGAMPSGEKFSGPIELRNVLMQRKGEFIRHLTGKVMGYALGRGLQDGDHCTIERIATRLEAGGYRGDALIREVVMSMPFRHVQRGAQLEHAEPPPKRIRSAVTK